MRVYAYLTAAAAALVARVRGEDPERGDVPGWVMITVMTAALVLAILIPFREAIVAAHPRREGGECDGQVRERAHGASFLLSVPRAHRASETMLINPGNKAKRTVTGSTRKTTGTIMAISFRPPASSSRRFPASRTSAA